MGELSREQVKRIYAQGCRRTTDERVSEIEEQLKACHGTETLSLFSFLERFCLKRSLKRHLVPHLSQSKIEQRSRAGGTGGVYVLRSAFKYFDTDQSGGLDIAELKNGLELFGDYAPL